MPFLTPFLALLSLVVAQIGQQDSSFFSISHHSGCSAFSRSPHTTNLTILDAIYYPANAPVDLANGQATVNTTALPAFCRLVLEIVTNPDTGKDAGAELWLPDDWNRRLMGFGNGGWGGGVDYRGISLDGVAQGYASYGTDTGHLGSMWDGSFGGPGKDDAIIDFGWRALHMTTVAAKSLTSEFYHQPYTKSYFMGCSTGGRQGIKAMSAFPEDYDGLVLGSPANPFGQLMPWQAKQGHHVHPVGSPQCIPEKTWNLIHAEILRQCDMLDGVLDGIISDPLACEFRPETLQCQPTADPSTCLTREQLSVLQTLYTPYYLGPSDSQTYVFSPFVPGGEYAYSQGLVGETHFRMPGDYYRYFVLNDTIWEDTQLDEAVVSMGIDINPGQMDTYSPDLTAFFARGGKVLQYAGWDDELVSTGHSINWYKDVAAYTRAHSGINPNDHFHLFLVPGMMHCVLGNGAWAFGGVLGRHFGGPPVANEAPYDIQAAMVDWLESDHTVTHLVAAKYRDDSAHSGGVAFTRKLCPYPQQARYMGGDQDKETSFKCW